MSIRELGGKLLFLISSLGLLIAVACQPARSAATQPQEEERLSSGPPSGTGMLWYDGSTLVYSAERDAWVTALDDKLGIYNINTEKILEHDPSQNLTIATNYCAGIGASGAISNGSSFLCEFKAPALFPPRCEFQSAASSGYIVTHELGHAGLNYLDEYVEQGMEGGQAGISVHSAFCSGGVGGVSFDLAAPVADPGVYRVASDGENLNCGVVDGRLVCAGGKADAQVAIKLCGPALGRVATPGGPTACPAGYLPGIDGHCIYSPVSKAPGLPGLDLRADDASSYSPLRLPTLEECPLPDQVRNSEGICGPRCDQGYTYQYKTADGTSKCVPCPAGSSSLGGACFTCPSGTISEPGGICHKYSCPEGTVPFGAGSCISYDSLAATIYAPTREAISASATAWKSSFLTSEVTRAVEAEATWRANYGTVVAGTQTALAQQEATRIAVEAATSTRVAKVQTAEVEVNATRTAFAATNIAYADWLTKLAYRCPEGMISLDGGATCISNSSANATLGVILTETAIYAGSVTPKPTATLSPAEISLTQTAKPVIESFSAAFTQTAAARITARAATESVIATATKVAIMTEASAPLTGSAGCPEGTVRDSSGACVPCPAGTIFDPVSWACVPVSAMWISRCPPGYYLDEGTGECAAPSGKAGCFGVTLTHEEFMACYPSGCPAGSSLDPALQCCQRNPAPAAVDQSCVTFEVQVPSCETRQTGGKNCGQYGSDFNSCIAAGCNWDPQYNTCK